MNLEAHRTLVDEVSARILLAALDRPRTALQIRSLTGVPVAQVFHRVKLLERRGLLAVAGTVMDRRGREAFLYRFNLYSAYVFVDPRGKLRARFQLVKEGQEDLAVRGSALI